MQEHTQSNSVDTIESYSSAPHSSKRVLIVTAVDAEKDAVLRGLKNASGFEVIAGGVGPAATAAATARQLMQTSTISLSAQASPEVLPVKLRLAPSSLRTSSLRRISDPKPKTASAAFRSSASERIGFRSMLPLPASLSRPWRMPAQP